MNITYEYRKRNGLCTRCGDRAEPGKTLCVGCSQLEAVKRMNRMDDNEYREKSRKYQREYQREYRKTHQVDKAKKSEYNRRYNLKNPQGRFVNRERWFNYNGERIRLPELAKRVDIPYQTMYQRVFRQGMSLSEAIARG